MRIPKGAYTLQADAQSSMSARTLCANNRGSLRRESEGWCCALGTCAFEFGSREVLAHLICVDPPLCTKPFAARFLLAMPGASNLRTSRDNTAVVLCLQDAAPQETSELFGLGITYLRATSCLAMAWPPGKQLTGFSAALRASLPPR